jgi:hypothetical protein
MTNSERAQMNQQEESAFIKALTRAARVLLLLGYSAMFVVGISSIWGWYVIGSVTSISLLALILDERRKTREIFKQGGGETDRRIESIFLALAIVAILTNVVVIGMDFVLD